MGRIAHVPVEQATMPIVAKSPTHGLTRVFFAMALMLAACIVYSGRDCINTVPKQPNQAPLRTTFTVIPQGTFICNDVVLGSNVSIGERVEIQCGAIIGDNVYLGNDVFIGSHMTIGPLSYIANGVTLIDSSVGHNVTVSCSVESPSCRLTIVDCVLGPNVVVIDVGSLAGKTYYDFETHVRERKSIDRSRCSYTKIDKSQCCRTTGLRLVLIYSFCLNNQTQRLVPVLSSARPCFTGDCIVSNGNIAREALTSCPTGLGDAAYAFGLQNNLAPYSNFLISGRTCTPPTTITRRRQRQAPGPTPNITSPSGVGRIGLNFDNISLYNFMDEIADPVSLTLNFLRSQGSLYMEGGGNLYPIKDGQMIVSISVNPSWVEPFNFTVWMQNFHALNIGYQAVDYFDRSACSKIVALRSKLSRSQLIRDRQNLRFVGPGKVDMVVYYNRTSSSSITGCTRRTPWITLMQPYGVSDNDFVCRPDAYNQVLGWCNVTDTPTGPQPTDLYVLPDGPEPGIVDDEDWEAWSEWSACKGSCPRGLVTRTRVCMQGRECDGAWIQTKGCSIPCPPVVQDPQWRPWSEWSDCSVSCDGGTRLRRRTCRVATCTGVRIQDEPCNVPPCCYGALVGFNMTNHLNITQANLYLTGVTTYLSNRCQFNGKGVSLDFVSTETSIVLGLTCSKSLVDNLVFLLDKECDVLHGGVGVSASNIYVVSPESVQANYSCTAPTTPQLPLPCPAKGEINAPN